MPMATMGSPILSLTLLVELMRLMALSKENLAIAAGECALFLYFTWHDATLLLAFRMIVARLFHVLYFTSFALCVALHEAYLTI